MRHLFRLLLSPDAAEGETPAPTPPTPQGDPPPAAALVIESGAREGDAGELLRLRRELEDEKKLRKAREVEVSEKEDALKRLTTPPTPATPATPPEDEQDDRWTIMG